MNLDRVRRQLERLRSEYLSTRSARKSEEARLEAEQRNLRDAVIARNLLQHAAQFAQEQAHAKIASVVTRCIRSVFGDEAPEFVIRFDRKRGRTEARLVFLVGGHEVDPQDADSGGLLDVASFALRLSVLCLRRPPLRRLLVLDEPFRYLDKDRKPLVRELVEALAGELGVQFILVTHDDTFQIGTVVQF